MRRSHRIGGALFATLLLATAAARAQTITRPPSGDNQRASVTQYIGPVKITINYNSPKVHSPANGEDRRGKIWGTLVPYGLAPDLGFGPCKNCPWRVGANENTVFTVSNDVKVQGQALPAGSYGMHMIPDPNEWTIIFSKNSTSWGSFFYDPAEDQLRVKAKPEKSEYHEYMAFEFPERGTTKATAAMRWEDLQVPFTISVDNLPDVYLGIIRNELHGSKGFSWENYNAAAQYALTNKVDLPEALGWAQTAVNGQFVGAENFQTLSTLSQLQAANGRDADSKKTIDLALNHPTASVTDIHQYGRQLLQQGKKEEALAIFQLNARKHPNVWPVNVGLMRGYAATGKKAEALKYARLALAQAPDDANRKNIERFIKQIEEGKDPG